MKPMSALNFQRTVMLSAAAFLLAGCNGGASEADLNASLPSSAHIKKHACDKAEGKPGYMCDVTLQQKQGDRMVKVKDAQDRYIQDENGDWKPVRG